MENPLFESKIPPYRAKALITVHADYDGLCNANALVKAAVKQGFDIVALVVSSRMNFDEFLRKHEESFGPEIRRAADLRERYFSRLVDFIDEEYRPDGNENYGRLLTFKQLAAIAGCPFEKTPTGFTGGKKIEEICRKLGPQQAPDVLLSGDTMAILNGNTIEPTAPAKKQVTLLENAADKNGGLNIPTYSACHPGLLPEYPGLYSPERMIIENALLPVGGKLSMISTSFRMEEGLDRGLIAMQTAVSYDASRSLMYNRSRLFAHSMDAFAYWFAEPIEDRLYKQRKPTKLFPNCANAISQRDYKPNTLTPQAVEQWLKSGVGRAVIDERDLAELLYNILPSGMRIESLPEHVRPPDMEFAKIMHAYNRKAPAHDNGTPYINLLSASHKRGWRKLPERTPG